MLMLSAILRTRSPEAVPDALLAEARQKVGNLSLTVIALVYVLLTLWQR